MLVQDYRQTNVSGFSSSFFFSLKMLTDLYLVHLLNEAAGHSVMVFCATCNSALRTSLLLRALGIAAVPLHGQMTQNKRLAALNKFKSRNRGVLLATDVASR